MASADYDRMKEVKEFSESKIGVKGLSDSGITSIPRIFIHPPQTLSQLKSTSSSSFSSIHTPVIDLSNLDSPHHRPKIVDQIREASKTWGFFQVINHGVALSVRTGGDGQRCQVFPRPATSSEGEDLRG